MTSLPLRIDLGPFVKARRWSAIIAAPNSASLRAVTAPSTSSARSRLRSGCVAKTVAKMSAMVATSGGGTCTSCSADLGVDRRQQQVGLRAKVAVDGARRDLRCGGQIA